MGEGRLRRLVIGILVSSTLSLFAALSIAQGDRAAYLTRLLRTSEAFRVRAQAALSLGQVSPAGPEVIEALVGALTGDSDAAVRAAACSSLERIGDRAALGAMRAAARDSEAAVRDCATHAVATLEHAAPGARGGGTAPPAGGAAGGGGSGPARFYVGVGQPGTKVRTVDAAVLTSTRQFIAGRVQQVAGVVVAPDQETPRQAQQVIRQRSLVGIYLDSSIVSLEARADGGVRAQVSIIVQTYPERDVRSMLSGAATVMGETGAAAQRAAIEAALNSALRNLPTAMAAGAPR